MPVTPTGLNDHGPTASRMLNSQLHGICYTDAALLAGGRVEGYWLLRREARLDAAFHYGSGDDDPTDGVHGTFDQLYPQGHAVDRAPQQLEPHARLDLGSRCVPARLMTLRIDLDREDDGRWLAEVPALSGVMCYGQSRADAVARVQALALRVIADRLEHGETEPALLDLSFEAG